MITSNELKLVTDNLPLRLIMQEATEMPLKQIILILSINYIVDGDLPTFETHKQH